MAFTFSVNALEKETEKTINYQEKKKKKKAPSYATAKNNL